MFSPIMKILLRQECDQESVTTAPKPAPEEKTIVAPDPDPGDAKAEGEIEVTIGADQKKIS